MKIRRSLIIIVAMLLTFSLTACKRKNMKEQAWDEAVAYLNWFADEEDADIKPGVYSEERVVKNSDDNYTCCVSLTTSEGGYDQWYITVEKKADGDWNVITVE